jgi:NDP-sugar pyrophosphorylase family protein
VQLAWVAAQGFSDVTLSVGYRAEMIREYVGDGQRFGLRVRYAEDGATPLGTGGAVKRAFPTPPPSVAVLYGDTVLDIDCRAVVAAAQGTHALMTVLPCPANEKPNATLDGALARYDKRAPEVAWRHIDYGLSVLSGQFLAEIPDTTPLDLAEPLGVASRAGRLAGYLATKPFHEINTPEALAAFSARYAVKGAR